MKTFEELEDGDKLYRLSYYGNGQFDAKINRDWDTYTIKKKHKNKCILKGGYSWTITRAMYGDRFFDSKAACCKEALRCYKISLEEEEEHIKAVKKEMKYLEKKIKADADADADILKTKSFRDQRRSLQADVQVSQEANDHA